MTTVNLVRTILDDVDWRRELFCRDDDTGLAKGVWVFLGPGRLVAFAERFITVFQPNS